VLVRLLGKSPESELGGGRVSFLLTQSHMRQEPDNNPIRARQALGHRVCGLQLIQRSEPRLVSTASRTDPPSTFCSSSSSSCVPPRADYVRRRVMRDCGVALPTQRLVDPLPVQSPWQYSGVDLLSNGFDITSPCPPGRPTPLPSNENRSASAGPSASLMFWHLLPARFGSINEYTGWK
jgi:hypothetical protein